MPTDKITLVHPDRKDTLTVTPAVARVHRRAGWITEAEAEQSKPDSAATTTPPKNTKAAASAKSEED